MLMGVGQAADRHRLRHLADGVRRLPRAGASDEVISPGDQSRWVRIVPTGVVVHRTFP
ncbi:hypothetical protein ACU4GD_40170 [Cupriavidus basilensis]